MINYEITKHDTGISKEYFNNHPTSHKKVYKVCDKCGKSAWIEFRNKSDFCRSCSLVGRKLSEEHKENMRGTRGKQK